MKLFYSPTSPFVRKVNVTAIELGIDDQIEKLAVDPWQSPTDLLAINPLSKVPCLVVENGNVIYDSPVIIEYLDTEFGNNRLLPREGDIRWQTLRLNALADGVIDAAVLAFLEREKRPQALRWAWWNDLQRDTIERSLDVLEAECGLFNEPLDLAQISIAVACAYVDFRVPDLNWRDSRPTLSIWYESFSERESMQATIPRPPAD